MSPSGAAILAHPIADARQSVSAAQAILYALSVGYGSEPLDPAHLRHVYEQGLVPAPTLANIVAHHGPWMRALGVDWSRVVHAEHRLTIHRPVPLDTPLVSRARTLCAVDRGVGKGLFVTFERIVAVAASGERVATIVQTNACRGDGGCGSAGVAPDPLETAPDRGPDAVLDLPIPESAALLYRLNGDLNPLHVDPETAARVGYPRPILHGLCTLGLAGYAICHWTEFGRPSRLSFLAARFSAPVYPGEHLCIEIWITGGNIRFRCTARDRGVRVLDYGHAERI